MEIKELNNLSTFSNQDLQEVLTNCDEKLSKMTAVDNIDEVLRLQEDAVAELQKRSK